MHAILVRHRQASTLTRAQLSVIDLDVGARFALETPHCLHVEHTHGMTITLQSDRTIHFDLLDATGALQKHAQLPSIGHFGCYKARFPYLATASLTAKIILLYDLRTTNIVRTIPIREDLAVNGSRLVTLVSYTSSARPPHLQTYIELDDDHVFLVSTEAIDLYHHRTSSLKHVIPLWTPPAIEQAARTWIHLQNTWLGLHHSQGCLVAIASFGQVLFVPRYRELLRDGLDLLSHSYALVFDDSDAFTSSLSFLAELRCERARLRPSAPLSRSTASRTVALSSPSRRCSPARSFDRCLLTRDPGH
jgi:hypothetical protein